jgi:hypothetical protein
VTLTNNHLCNNDKFLGFVVHRFDCGSNVHVLTKLLTNIVPTTCSTFETIYQIINFQAFWETNRVKKKKKKLIVPTNEINSNYFLSDLENAQSTCEAWLSILEFATFSRCTTIRRLVTTKSLSTPGIDWQS